MLAQIQASHHPRHPGQGPQVFGARVWGRQQGEDQVRRLVIHRVEGDGMIQAQKDTANPVEPLDPRMGHGYAIADTRRSGLLPLGQGVEDDTGVQGKMSPGELGQVSQNLPLVGRADPQRDGAAVKDVADLHAWFGRPVLTDPEPESRSLRELEMAPPPQAAPSAPFPFTDFVRSGSIQPIFPSGRRYTTDNPPCAAFLNTIV